MKIICYRGRHPNFGDELNLWLWPRLIPNFFDDDDKTAFLGIGSIIGAKIYRDSAHKIVFGSAFVPEYHQCPSIKDTKWTVYFVRGPRTAASLGISPKLGLGDPAILLRTVLGPSTHLPNLVSFMPHWESLERGNWLEACRLAGFSLIDPRSSVEGVVDQIRQSKLLLTESLHGAIVADALRVPWVSLLPLNPMHRGKWMDWAEALGIALRPRRLIPSTLLEARLSILRKPITASPISGLLQAGLVHAAAHHLVKLSRVTPQLSEDGNMKRATDAMLSMVAQLQRDFQPQQEVNTPARIKI